MDDFTDGVVFGGGLVVALFALQDRAVLHMTLGIAAMGLVLFARWAGGRWGRGRHATTQD